MATLTASFRAPFARYRLSGFLANFGDGIRLAALPLLATRFTASPAAVAAVTAVQGLPWVLTGAGAGVIVDRVDRRAVMVTVDLARAAVIAGLAVAVLAHSADLLLIYLTASVTGIGTALRVTAAVTCVPQLVKSADLDEANGQVTAANIVGSELAGPAAGGWLFGLAAALPFVATAGALGIAALLLLTLPGVFRPPPRAGQAPASALGSVRQDLGEGVRWLREHSEIRDLTLAVGVIAAMDAAWIAVLVLYVFRILHQNAGIYGLLLAIAALGGIVAGAVGARLTRRAGPWRSLLIAALVMAATQTMLGLTANVITAAAMLCASSAAWALFDMTAVTMRQRVIPAELLGRVSSLYSTVFGSAEALGAIAGGALATAAGIRAPMLAGAVPIVAVAAVLAWRHRRSADDGPLMPSALP